MLFRTICIGLLTTLAVLPGCRSPRRPASTLYDYTPRAVSVFLYYRNVPAAEKFYTEILGLEKAADYGFAKILSVAHDSFIILVDAAHGMHTADEPKTVALALVTEQLEEWYDHILSRGVSIKYPLKINPGSPHDGFVAVDPEGYLLEFERFNPHSENSELIPLLEKNTAASFGMDAENDKLGFHSTVTWLYYRDLPQAQEFYEEKLGLRLTADQGWAKIYHIAGTGFLGLVDGARGMHSWTETKAVNAGFILQDLPGWFSRVQADTLFPLRTGAVYRDPEGRFEEFVGFDPGGYYLEFDRFYPHALNERLMQLLKEN